MAKSLRSKRIAELQARAKRTDILWMHRRNALHCLTGVQKLGQKTQIWIQRLLDTCRDQYSELETLKEIDTLQERLDHQKELLKRRLARKADKEQAEQGTKAPEPKPSLAPLPGETDVWDT